MSAQTATGGVSQQLAAAPVVADWLVANSADTVVIERTLSDRAAGGQYTVMINDSVNRHLLIESQARNTDTNVTVVNCTNIAGETARGGDLSIVPAEDTLEVQRA